MYDGSDAKQYECSYTIQHNYFHKTERTHVPRPKSLLV